MVAVVDIVKRTKAAVELKYYQYELTLGLYMLEPWEKIIFNTIVLIFLTFFTYAAYSRLPDYTSYLVKKSQYYLLNMETH
ncbi:hypothetical protein HK102_010510 [Quaeritorhiza haematococci]|nr:hypothetical protein HK102_010510 [Quaeritorhiza haematococci]